MSNVYSLTSAGHVKRAVLAACDRLALCSTTRRDCVDRAMHVLRSKGSPASAVKAGRALARQMAGAARMFRGEPA